MVAALRSLRQIVEADRSEPSQNKIRLSGLGGTRPSLYELKLPPADLVLDILRKSKDKMIFVFDTPLSFTTRDHFNQLCKIVYFRTEDYPASTAVLFHGDLMKLFQEIKWHETDPKVKQQCSEWAQICQENLEISISLLDSWIPTTLESALALLLASAYCMEIAQASICKKLTIHGSSMVQSLGWHRAAAMANDNDVVRKRKLLIFWMFYTIDKSLTLRLGQASVIQDYDIDLPLPWIDTSAPLPSLGRMNRWAVAGRLMGLIYQQLYSPGALKQTDSLRLQAVQELLLQIHLIRPKTSREDGLTQLIQSAEFAASSYIYDFNEVIYKSDEFAYHALLCLVHRATPASTYTSLDYDPVHECSGSARAALDCHESCTSKFKARTEVWTTYLNWTVLNYPFVPFTTLFSHVLATHDRTDLQRLHQFADSMSDCPTSQTAHKISRLASVFVGVATAYIESSEEEATKSAQEQQHMVPIDTATTTTTHDPNTQDKPYHSDGAFQQQPATFPMPAWASFDPFLDAFGLADDQTLTAEGDLSGATGTTATTTMNLENWFNGNQHIMGLLEDDLSYLDSMVLETLPHS